MHVHKYVALIPKTTWLALTKSFKRGLCEVVVNMFPPIQFRLQINDNIGLRHYALRIPLIYS